MPGTKRMLAELQALEAPTTKRRRRDPPAEEASSSQTRGTAAQSNGESSAHPPPPPVNPVLQRLRNMWQFSNLAQYLFMFGKALKIEHDLSIEALEKECLVPGTSQVFLDVGLILLKLISTQRGLNASIFDEYMKREYRKRYTRDQESQIWRGQANAKLKENPFGEDEDQKSFKDFDVFSQIEILQQLSQWTLTKPELLREKMNEAEAEQLLWRMDIYGWDSEEREYFLLDDNRLYRRPDPVADLQPSATARPWKPKANTIKAKAAARASRRRAAAQGNAQEEEQNTTSEEPHQKEEIADKVEWECVAVTLSQYQEFLGNLSKSKDQNEKNLRERIKDEVMPVLEKAEEDNQRKAAKLEKEMMNLERLAGAKRSSRVAAKQARMKIEEEALQAAKEQEAESQKAEKEERRRQKLEDERISRLLTREKRAEERNNRRQQREEELASLEKEGSRDGDEGTSNQARISERRRKAREESLRRELDQLKDDDWYFDCSVCGVHGRNEDDGARSIACDKCNVWQHVHCLGLEEEAAQPDFDFVCKLCLQKIEEEKEAAAKPPLKLTFKVPVASVEDLNGAAQNSEFIGGNTINIVHPSTNQPNGTPGPSSYHLQGKASQPNGEESTASEHNHSKNHGQNTSTPHSMSNGSGRKRSHQDDEEVESPKRPRLDDAAPSLGISKASANLMKGPNLSPQGQLPGTIDGQQSDKNDWSLGQNPQPTPTKAPSPPMANGVFKPTTYLPPVHPTQSFSDANGQVPPSTPLARGTTTPAPAVNGPVRTGPAAAPNILFDNNNQQSPRVNLPSSSPAAVNGTGAIPPPSAGLSPTKHAMAPSPSQSSS